MKRTIALFTLFCFILVFTGCQKGNSVKDIQNPDQSINVDGTNEFKKALQENKIQFNTEEIKDKGMIIPKKRELLSINGEKVIVYKFDSIKEAEEYKSNFDIGGCTIGNSKVSWAGYPHFYQKWNLIIEYVGYSDELVNNLENILGTEFSGFYAVGNRSHPKKN